jgi:hypothetical protein
MANAFTVTISVDVEYELLEAFKSFLFGDVDYDLDFDHEENEEGEGDSNNAASPADVNTDPAVPAVPA